MKLFLIKPKYLLLSFVLILFLASCTTLDLFEANSSKFDQVNIKKNECPIGKIPSKTANYITNKKYILSIKKIEMVCTSESVSNSDELDFIVQYKAKMELKIYRKIKKKNFTLPSIYIAIVDMSHEKVLAKMKSYVEISSREGNLIVNKNKFRFKYNNYENLYIYFGLQ